MASSGLTFSRLIWCQLPTKLRSRPLVSQTSLVPFASASNTCRTFFASSPQHALRSRPISTDERHGSASERQPDIRSNSVAAKRRHTPKPRSSRETTKTPIRGNKSPNDSFRIRAKELSSQLERIAAELADHRRHVPVSKEKVQAKISQAILLLETEMKALRVMIKDKDMQQDPDNAWISASRLKTPYNTVLSMCLADGRVDYAYQLYNRMKKDGIFPNAATFNVLITGTMRAHLLQQDTTSIDANTTSFKRVQPITEELQELWKRSFPRYFGSLETEMQPKSSLANQLREAESDQERRNLLSQQSSILEARQFPHVLTNALNAYAHFLRQSEQVDEAWKLFDRLFPPQYLDPFYKATIGPKSDLFHRSLLDLLPAGDISTITTFLSFAHTPSPLATKKRPRPMDPYNNLKRVWNTWIKLIQAEQTVPKMPSGWEANMKLDQKASPLKEAKGTLSAIPNSSKPAPGPLARSTNRFLPDEQAMQTFLNKLHHTPESNWKSLTLTVLESVYGLDLSKQCDGILRDPRRGTASDGSSLFLKNKDLAIDALPPAAQLRDLHTIHLVFRLLSAPASWKERVSLFNFVWMRAYEENSCSSAAPFGPSIGPSSALSLLYTLSTKGDPRAARLLLDKMNEAADHAGCKPHGQNKRRHMATTGREVKDAQMARRWIPLDISYLRTLKAIQAAGSRGPDGLTALKSQSDADAQVNTSIPFDAWKEAKDVFAIWHTNDEVRMLVSEASIHDTRWNSDYPAGSNRDRKSGRQPIPALLHKDAIVSTVLRIANPSAAVSGGPPSVIAREALDLIDSTLDISKLINEMKEYMLAVRLHKPSLHYKVAEHKFSTIQELSRILNAALDTDHHSYASKSQVHLWKSLKSELVDLGFSARFPRKGGDFLQEERSNMHLTLREGRADPVLEDKDVDYRANSTRASLLRI